MMMVLDPSLNLGELELIFAGADLSKVRNEGGSLGKAFRKTNERERRRGLRRSVLCWTRKSAFRSDSLVIKIR